MNAARWIIGLLILPIVASIRGDEGRSPTNVAESPQTIRPADHGYLPQEGDLILHAEKYTDSGFYEALEDITQTRFTNCGIVKKQIGDGGERWVVVEVYDMVVERKLEEFLGRGRDGAYVVFRPTETYAAKAAEFAAAAQRHVGKTEDLHFEFDDAKLYPAELAFKAFREATGDPLGRTCKFRDLNWKPYEWKLRFAGGGSLPLENEVTTLKLISEAPQLREVFRQGM